MEKIALGLVKSENQIVPVWLSGADTQFSSILWIVYEPCKYANHDFVMIGVDEAEHPVRSNGTLVPPDEYLERLRNRRGLQAEAILQAACKHLGGDCPPRRDI